MLNKLNQKLRLKPINIWIPLILTSGVFLFDIDSAKAENTCTVSSSPVNNPSYTETVASGKTTTLTSSYTVVFNCINTDIANLSVTLKSLTAPDFNNAENIDLINGDTTGVSHQVIVSVSGATQTNPVTVTANNGNDEQILNNFNLTPTSNQISVTVTSNFILTGGAQELGAGNYGAGFEVNLTQNTDQPVNTQISGILTGKCSVARPAESSIKAKAYTAVNVGGITTRLEASDSILFDCNSNNVAYNVILTELQTPNNNSLVGIDHQVGMIGRDPVSMLLTTRSATTQGASLLNNFSSPTNINGDVDMELTSQFITTNGVNFLPAGTYLTKYTITVSPQ